MSSAEPEGSAAIASCSSAVMSASTAVSCAAASRLNPIVVSAGSVADDSVRARRRGLAVGLARSASLRHVGIRHG